MTNITIHSPALSVGIAPTGAELQSIRDTAGRNQPARRLQLFGATAPRPPVPIVGALVDNTHVVDGTAYHLPKHGFARRSLFEAVDLLADRGRGSA